MAVVVQPGSPEPAVQRSHVVRDGGERAPTAKPEKARKGVHGEGQDRAEGATPQGRGDSKPADLVKPPAPAGLGGHILGQPSFDELTGRRVGDVHPAVLEQTSDQRLAAVEVVDLRTDGADDCAVRKAGCKDVPRHRIGAVDRRASRPHVDGRPERRRAAQQLPMARGIDDGSSQRRADQPSGRRQYYELDVRQSGQQVTLDRQAPAAERWD